MYSSTNTTILTSDKRVQMTSLRRTALVAGLIYLVTFISIPTLSLYGPIHDIYYITGPGPDTGVIIGGILEIIVALAGIGTAVVLYPVLKRQNEAGALGLVAARVLEAGTIFAGVACLLTIVALRQTGAGANAWVIGQTLVTMYDQIFQIGQSFMPVVDDLLLGFLLFQSRLVPRGLSLLGIIGGVVLLAGDMGVLFGFLEPRTAPTMLTALPVAVFEFSLGLWLVIKGFNHSPYKSQFSPLSAI